MADHIASYGLEVGSFVAPIWDGAGGGSAMGSEDERRQFLSQVRKACEIGRQMRELGIRPTGGIRVDSSTSVEVWDKDPVADSKLIAETFSKAGGHRRGPRRVSSSPRARICWGGMHSWRDDARPARRRSTGRARSASRPTWRTRCSTPSATTPRQDRILPADFDWADKEALDAAYRKVADALRPWTLDFHVAQNDGTVFGSGDHAKTGRHVPVDDPNGRLDVVKHAGFWLRDENGNLTKTMRHICWDGCMLPNAVMEDQQTWNNVLAAMVKVRDAHGWTE